MALGASLLSGDEPTGSTSTATTSAPPATATTPASVVVVQATTTASIALGAIPTTRIEVPITLEERGGGVANGLTLRVEPLANVSGAVPLRFVPAAEGTLPAVLPPYGQLSGKLVADLPHAGDYTSSLRLLYNGKIQGIYAITLSRAVAAVAAPTALPLDPGELSDILVEVWPYAEQSVVVTTTLAPSGAEPVTVAEPSLRTLTQKIGENNLGADAATMAVTEDGKKALKFPLTLQPGQTQPLRLAIGGVDGAGRYDAKIRFQGPGRTPIDKTIVVRAREGRWVAFLCTALGVAASFLLRRWYTSRRPRLVLERRVAALDATVSEAAAQAAQDAVIQEVAAALGAQVTRAWKNAILTEAWTDLASFVLLERKVDLMLGWISARVAVSRTKPPSVASAVADDMDGVEKFLRMPGVTDQALAAQEKTLGEIPGKLRGAASKEIRTRVESLTAQVDAIVKNRPLLKAPIDADVRPLLTRVTEKLGADDFDTALSVIEEARKQYAIVLAKALRSDLGRPVPEMVDARVWTNLQERLRYPLENVGRAESADDAMRQFETALGTYAREMAAALIVSAKKALPAAAADEARKATLTKLIKDLDAVDVKIGTGKVIEAWNDVVTSHEALTDFDPRTASSMGDAAAPARAIVFSRDESLQEPIAVGTPALREHRAFTEVESELHWGDRVAAIAAVLIATAVGIGVLWNSSLTWGGPGDQLAAVLWGLGVHQLSYNGLASVIEKFAK
jgi:hypothetical protein